MLDIMLRIAYLSAIGLSLYTSGWLLMKADKTRTTGALAACQLLIIIWCMPQLFSALPMTKGMKYLAYGISYIGISFIGPAWLEFAFLYSRRKLGHGAELFLFGISAVNYSVLLTNEYHHLFYASFEVAQVVYGPVFYIHMAYTYICVLAGMAVVLAAFKKNRVALAHIAVILLAAAVPLAFNLLYMTGLVRTGFDLTPPAFSLTSVLMLLAVFRYDFLDVNTMAFDKIFDSIAEGVVVYNRRDKITYCNGAAVHWLGLQTGDDMEPLRRILREKGADADCADSQTPVFTLEDNGERRRLEVRQYIHRDKKGDMVAGTIMLTDVGRYYQLLEQGRELAVTNQSLAIEKERNRIAQEVHDTAGHTLTMINSLLFPCPAHQPQTGRRKIGFPRVPGASAPMRHTQRPQTGTHPPPSVPGPGGSGAHIFACIPVKILSGPSPSSESPHIPCCPDDIWDGYPRQLPVPSSPDSRMLPPAVSLRPQYNLRR